MKKKYFLLNLIAIIFCVFNSVNAQSELFIANNGNDTNAGTINEPLATLIGARNKARATGARTIWIRGGRYNFNETCNLGAQDSGVTYSNYNDELVIFDGSEYVEPQGFDIVTNSQELNRLNPSAKGNVSSTLIEDPNLIALLSEKTAQISINDEMKTLARFPNIGFTHMDRNSVNVSQEVNNTIGTYDNPRGGQFKLTESINANKWNEEISRTQAVQLSGYISATWFNESNEIHSVSSSGEFKLLSGTRYGLDDLRNRPRRFFVYNLLYELDEPGEWYFDKIDSRLYIWFDTNVNQNTIIGVWAGPQLFEIRDASDITVKGITIQNIGKANTNGEGAINIIGRSDNILIAGVVFRFISEKLTAFNIWREVTNSTITSCDIYDSQGGRLYGGSTTPNSITFGNNKVENCHFTQIYSRSFYGKSIGIEGVGNTFRNNLIHNINGQPITHRGHEHVIERNELFNVGVEEGDGGAIYTGNAIWSYGNKVRHNFIHHIMSIPGLIGRASIHIDDLDAGDQIEENVIYKGGWRSIQFNNGSGHNVFRNVILGGHIGVRDKDDDRGKYEAAMEFISNNDAQSNIKANYVGRMLKTIGKPNWESTLTTENWSEQANPFWINRYPKMQLVFDRYNNTDVFGAYETRVYDNLFGDNVENIDSSPLVGIRDNTEVGYDIFEDFNTLNFKFKTPLPSYAPNIPFERIGLYNDQYRCAVPDKNVYRRNMKQRFDGQASWDGTLRYDFDTVNDLLYYNSGEMVFATIPCANVLPEISEEVEYKFDLGTGNSEVFEDYIRVSNVTKGINFGWANTEGLESKDLGIQGGTNDLNRDFVQSKATRTFEARVSNSNWSVLITFGDKNRSHDNMQVKAEGEIVFNNINTQPNEFFNREVDIDVRDGKISLEFSDQGGSDEFWQATRIWLRRNGETLSEKENTLTELISIYPNPAKTVLNINSSKQANNMSYEVIDSLGRIIVLETNMKSENNLDVSGLSTGIYFIKIKLDNQQITKRFIKQ